MNIYRSWSYVLLLLLIFRISSIQSDTILYDTIVCFGDSHSDTGNVYNLTGLQSPPSPPYYQGRFSNGRLWIEKLEISNTMNYAYGSATTDNNLVIGFTAPNLSVPGVRQQIILYRNQTDLTKVDFSRTIYAIWAGGNDYYFNISIDPLTVVSSLINSIIDLIQIGAKHFLILNQSPFQAYPAYLGANMNDFLNTTTLSHNNYLLNSISNLRKNFSNISFDFYDVYSLITNIINNSLAYGINNTKNCWSTASGTIIPLCTTPNSSLFIDEYHFTTPIHQFIADEIKPLLRTSNGIRQTSYSIFFYIILYFLIKILK